jgi:hypothetical protein
VLWQHAALQVVLDECQVGFRASLPSCVHLLLLLFLGQTTLMLLEHLRPKLLQQSLLTIIINELVLHYFFSKGIKLD